jgi:hypothetical protein
MKREIKFRAWDGIRKEMFYPYCLEHINGILTAKRYVTDENADVLTVLMQFTGLHDKSGEEIYEGDIVETDHILIPTAIVCYVNGGFEAKAIKDDVYISEKRAIKKVIGNIYENHDLLK